MISSSTIRTFRECKIGRRRNRLVTRAVSKEEDDVLPLFRLPPKETEVPQSTTKEQRGTLGTKTVGEELARIHEQMKTRDSSAKERMDSELYSNNWEGDVYVGSDWNVGTVLLLVFFLVMIGLSAFAYLTYGTVWGTTPDMQF